MPISEDFADLTPPVNPKKRYRYPTAEATGAIPWPAGQTFAKALADGLPGAIRSRILTFDATIRIRLEVTED